MTEDQQEALSTRYIAPRIMRLTSGNIAIVSMVGDSRIEILEPRDFHALSGMIPTTDELCAQVDRITARRAFAPRPATPTLDDLV